MTLSLVVLAAGLGSRFGGTKQLAAVGPSGEVILDYTIHDALDAGFERVVLVVRSDIEQDVVDHVRRQFGDDLDLSAVCQDLHGPARDKPWGTAHAVLTAAPVVDGPFAVVNADDFYGRESFEVLAKAMQSNTDAAALQLVGFRLANTLSASGTVSRGVCAVDENRRLVSITEHLEIGRASGDDGRDVITSHGTGQTLAATTPVSMQLWGLQSMVFDHLDRRFGSFVDDVVDQPKAEFQLPTEIDRLIQSGDSTVTVLDTGASWIGVTHPDDLQTARDDIADLIASGTYTSPLS